MVTSHIILNGDKRKPGGIKQGDHISICSSPDGVEGLEDLRDCDIWLQRRHQTPAVQLLAGNAFHSRLETIELTYAL